MAKASALQKALEKGLSKGDLDEALSDLGDYEIDSAEDAQAICNALEQLLSKIKSAGSAKKFLDDLHALTVLFQEVAGPDAHEVFTERGLPLLEQAYDLYHKQMSPDDVLFTLKIFAAYGYEPGVKKIPEAIRRPKLKDHFLWTILFETLLQEDHPQQKWVAEQLRDPLPEDFARVAYLDYVNELCLDEVLDSHPFDTDEGRAFLRECLEKKDPEESSYAVSAATACGLIGGPEQEQLLELAKNHPEMEVQMEAAWADAYNERESGIQFLVDKCLDPNYSAQAIEYLESLDLKDRVPKQALDPDFQAKSQMIEWLMDPREYGEPPDSIELVDTREMYWPPTEDTRRLWVFQYTYGPEEEGEEPDTQYGMVGSTTFSLFDEYDDVESVEDVYALHCSWELEGEADLKKGRRLLKRSK